jgi:molybdenum-dependent DNA-binding transcriptional regulator ModE
MSYRRAWVLIDSMNNQVSKPFVVTSAGGKRGGGTRVTAEGERAIAEFWKIHNDFQKFLKSKDRAVAAMLGGEKEDPGVLDAKKRKVPRASAADTLTHAAERKKGA